MRSKCVDEIFGYIIDDDFNPDGVQCGLLDCYDYGFYAGIVVGSIAAIGVVSLMFVYKKYKTRRSIND